ncbi:MAG TPA: P22 phage major capsid protein family protein [Sphingomicrobium sp.]|nr:P22 phage major capsid protein family protein [Sphingomicrobium sp.]
MANSLLTPDIIAKEALMQLENNLVAARLVHRAYEDEFTQLSNGNKVGSTITIRKPVRYQVRSGAVAAAQDTTEGQTSIVIDRQRGIDLQFTSQQLTLDIEKFGERYLAPAMSQLANEVDMDLYGLYKYVPNWVGTPGQTINSFADFAVGPERLDELAVPATDRRGILSPADYWGTLGSFTALFANQGKTAEDALRRANLGMIAQVDTYQAQNIKTHTRGTADNTTPLVKGASQDRAYTDYVNDSSGTLVKDVAGTSQTLDTDGWDNSATLKAGDIFTIQDVYAVNPVSKQTLPFLRQFVILEDVTAHASGGTTTLTISPAIITSGPYKTCSAAPADDAPITIVGTASTGYRQNLLFHKNAFALCMVPMELPEGAVRAAQHSYEGLSIRVIPYYDGTNDVSNWRFDILYGVKAIYPELAVRLSGT